MAKLIGCILHLCAAVFVNPARADQLPQLPVLPSSQDLEQAMAPSTAVGTSSLAGLSVQLWGLRELARAESGSDHSGRLVFDYARTWQLAPNWTARLSNQLDLVTRGRQPNEDSGRALNTLREAWLGWRNTNGSGQYYLDVGRINLRNGVGSGYNPTDFFKRNAVNRVAATLDPGALRENRMGAVMLRAQYIGDSGALTVALAPRLARERSDNDLRGAGSLAFDRTNGRGASYIKWAPQISQRVALEMLVFKRELEPAQMGLNLSVLASESVVVNAEWAGGNRQDLSGPDDEGRQWRWRNRAAANLVWTTPFGLDLTVERDYAQEALDRDQWRRWRDVADGYQLKALTALAERRQIEQEPLLRDAWFARIHWRDAFGMRNFELAGFTLRNLYDHSALTQLTATRGLGERWRIGLLMADYRGDRTSEFGSIPVRRKLAAYLDYRF